MPDHIITIAVAIISAFGGGLGAAWLSRRKTAAEVTQITIDTATRLFREYREVLDRHEREILAQAKEIQAQSVAIENLNGQLLRYLLIIDIFFQYVQKLGVKPVLSRIDIEQMPYDELSRVARMLRNG